MIDHVIKAIRKERNLTQKELADLLYVTDKTVSSWENGRTVPDIYTLEKLSTVFGIPMNDLMQGDISKWSKTKYKIKLSLNRWFQWIKPHSILWIWTFLLVIGYGLTLIKWPLITMWLIYLYMGAFIITKGLKSSKWHYIGLFTGLSIVVPNGLALVNPTLYGSWVEANTHHWIQAIWVYGFLIAAAIGIVWMTIQSIKHKKLSLSHGYVLLTQVGLWLMVYYSYKVVKLSMVYSTWTHEWTAQLIQSSQSYIFSGIVFGIMGLLIILEQRLKGETH